MNQVNLLFLLGSTSFLMGCPQQPVSTVVDGGGYACLEDDGNDDHEHGPDPRGAR
jgi:hypothetical protein